MERKIWKSYFADSSFGVFNPKLSIQENVTFTFSILTLLYIITKYKQFAAKHMKINKNVSVWEKEMTEMSQTYSQWL